MRALVLCLLAVLGAFASPARRPLFSRGYPQIVGGKDAAPGEFPYQLSFQDTSHGYNFHFCGASIYDTVNAITAAHCVYGMNYDSPRDLVVVAGEVKLYANGEDAQAVPVVRIAINEGFSYSNLYNDVAILKVGTEFEFSDKVGPIALPRKGQKTTGSCTVTGWGALSPGGPSPDILQKVEVPVVADEDCRRSYGSSAIADSMICAGRGGKDACQGDSGGPMKCGNYLGGIVSWGHGCARPLYPGVYTEVSYFIDWIEEHLF